MLVSLAAGGGFWRGNQGLFLGAFLGDIIEVMEPIVAWKKSLKAGSLVSDPSVKEKQPGL